MLSSNRRQQGAQDIMVLSWPPPWDAVEVNRPKGLPTRAPLCQRPPVASQKALNCPGMPPYLRGSMEQGCSPEVLRMVWY